MQIIAGSHRHRRIAAPKGQNTRPTSSRLRETLFNIIQNSIEGASFLDLFAGSGAMGLEALSRGAKNVLFVDSSREAIRCIRDNIRNLELEAVSSVRQGAAFLILDRLIKEKRTFDVIYADAPYSATSEISHKLLELIDNTSLLNSGGMLFIEDTAKTHGEDFRTLKLISERRSGHSYLHQYKKL